MATITVTNDYNVSLTDDVILVNATSNDVELTLPSSHTAGIRYTVKDRDGKAKVRNITIVTSDSDTIDGDASKQLRVPYQALTIHSDGTNWALM